MQHIVELRRSGWTDRSTNICTDGRTTIAIIIVDYIYVIYTDYVGLYDFTSSSSITNSLHDEYLSHDFFKIICFFSCTHSSNFSNIYLYPIHSMKDYQGRSSRNFSRNTNARILSAKGCYNNSNLTSGELNLGRICPSHR
jgi:hypothetical protein